jgi:hypothetical protein
MITEEQVNAAGVAYWNYFRRTGGRPESKPFKLDKEFAAAIRAALEAAEKVGHAQ